MSSMRGKGQVVMLFMPAEMSYATGSVQVHDLPYI